MDFTLMTYELEVEVNRIVLQMQIEDECLLECSAIAECTENNLLRCVFLC